MDAQKLIEIQPQLIPLFLYSLFMPYPRNPPMMSAQRKRAPKALFFPTQDYRQVAGKYFGFKLPAQVQIMAEGGGVPATKAAGATAGIAGE